MFRGVGRIRVFEAREIELILVNELDGGHTMAQKQVDWSPA